MDDLISRQAAIDEFLTELTKRERNNLLHTWSTVEVKYFIAKTLEKLPSAQPEQKKGEWLEHYAHEDGERDGVWCSECREHYYFGGQLMNFCPNCGADMRNN